MDGLRELVAGLTDLVYPPVCFLCETSTAGLESHELCPGCSQALCADTASCCERCGATVGPHVPTDAGCLQCKDESYQFEGVLRLGRYEGKLREAILKMKYADGESLAEALALRWAEHQRERFERLAIDLVMPVPLHWLRWWRRGYNQAEALARSLAWCLKKPCRTRWLWRRRHTPLQARQTPTDRRKHMRGTFKAWPKAGLRGARVLLVDDVFTTGSTCNDAARALKGAGARAVVVAVLARSEAR
jgi:ComF family protein